MLCRYRLKFKQDQLENCYFDQSIPQFSKEFRNFVIQIFVQQYHFQLKLKIFSSTQLYVFVTNQYIFYIVLTFIVLFLSLILYSIIRNKPAAINYVLIFSQIATAFIYNSTVYVDSSNKPELNLAFYYGFQCAFFHIQIYLQGTHFISQTITLMGVIGWYQFYNNNKTTEMVVNNFTLLQVFFGLVLIRYTLEKQKRDLFIQSIEQKKWDTVIEEVISSWLIASYYDKRQDQIMMKKCNKYFKIQFKINDDKDFRLIMRNIYVREIIKILPYSKGKENTSVRVDNFESTLETQIRNFLLFNDERNASESLKNQTYREYVGYYKQNKNKKLIIKLINFYQNDMRMTLISINEHQKIEKKGNSAIFLQQREDLLKQILFESIQVQSPILSFIKLAIVQQSISAQMKFRLHNLLNIGYLAYNTQLNAYQFYKSNKPDNFKSQLIYVTSILRDIKFVFKNRFKINVKQSNAQSFTSDYQKIMMIIYSIFDCLLINQKNARHNQIRIGFRHKGEYLKISVNHESIIIPEGIRKIILKGWAISKDLKQLHRRRNFSKILIQLQKISQNGQSRIQLAYFNICIAQYLITQIGPFNRFFINLGRNKISFLIFQNLQQGRSNIYSKEQNMNIIKQPLLLLSPHVELQASEINESAFMNLQNQKKFTNIGQQMDQNIG